MIKKFQDFVNEGKYKEDEELNRILDKISASGIESITAKEKAYLDGDVQQEPEYNGLYNNDSTIGEDGEYLDANKSNFIFKIYDLDQDEYLSSTPFGIAVFDKAGKFMVDEHVTDELFPELKKIGLEDLAEGELEYMGQLNKEALIDKLKSMGFNAVASNRPY